MTKAEQHARNQRQLNAAVSRAEARVVKAAFDAGFDAHEASQISGATPPVDTPTHLSNRHKAFAEYVDSLNEALTDDQ